MGGRVGLVRNPLGKKLLAFLGGFFERVGKVDAEALIGSEPVTCLL
jgi:hypothetical protein